MVLTLTVSHHWGLVLGLLVVLTLTVSHHLGLVLGLLVVLTLTVSHHSSIGNCSVKVTRVTFTAVPKCAELKALHGCVGSIMIGRLPAMASVTFMSL